MFFNKNEKLVRDLHVKDKEIDELKKELEEANLTISSLEKKVEFSLNYAKKIQFRDWKGIRL